MFKPLYDFHSEHFLPPHPPLIWPSVRLLPSFSQKKKLLSLHHPSPRKRSGGVGGSGENLEGVMQVPLITRLGL